VCLIVCVNVQVGVYHALNLTRGAGNRVKIIVNEIIVYTNKRLLSLSG